MTETPPHSLENESARHVPDVDPRIAAVNAFWRHAGIDKWFAKDPTFDTDFRQRFEALHFAAAARQLDHWVDTAEGALALMVLLDQFPRNSYRNTGHMFATDKLALRFARIAVDRGLDMQIEQELRVFFYLPFEHSEELEDQDRAVRLCHASLDAEAIKFAHIHQDIIARFGRYPHRNPMFGRDTTPEEQAFLDGGGFAG
ncbi:DUF924 family protein [Aquabacter sp. CN5-332]|uniref:DUF924 family protein n=1 Tax=Aquabacter sp. CN5-332 TaxID=3156608 RepID=UPI0032B38A11